jgi:DNA-binding CsgD family transcriptional regulator
MSALRAAGAGVLLERERQLARADREFDRLCGGVGSVVVVEGPAGIGKSELLAAIREHGRARGFGVLRARGSEFEQEIAFGVARQLFEPMLRTAAAGVRRRLLDGVARVGARALGVGAGQAPADRSAAIHGLYWLCANRAEQGPLVVVVDDVQWVDDPSLGWLGYLARRAGDLAVLVVLGLRSGDPGGERAELASLAGGACQRIMLEPLSAGAVSAIVRAELGEDADQPFCAVCSELTGGNPLFVRELLAAACEEGLAARGESVGGLRRIAPSAVGTSVLARLGRLGAEAVALARAVAVLGPGAEVILAAQLAGLDPVVAELTADRLAAAQILAAVRPLEFFHPLIGAAVREDTPPGARRVAHRRAAALVAGEGPLARVAAHLLACGPAGDRWVVQQLGDAAREAFDRGAPDVAASYMRRAISEPPAADDRATLLLLLGSAEWRAGQPDAIFHLEQAVAAARDDVRMQIAASVRLARAYNVTDQAERAVEILERVLAAAGETDTGLALRLEAGTAVIGMVNERTAPGALRRAEALRGRVPLAGSPALLLVMLAYYAARDNRAADARDLAERALACGPYPPPLDISTVLIVTLTLVESYDTLDRLCGDSLAAARRRGAIQELAGISAYRAWAWFDRGALAEAEADARWALERAEGIVRLHAATEVIRVLVERDQLQAAEEMLAQSVEPRASHSIEVPRFLFARGRLRAAQGRLHDARDDLFECGQRCAAFGLWTLSASSWRAEAALACSALGDIEQARRLAHEQLALAREFGCPRTLGISLRAAGLVEGGAAGFTLLIEAVNTLERSQAQLEFARALTDHGAMLRRAGQRTRAREQLERGLDIAHRLGALRIASQARAELIAAGAKPRRDAITGRDALTAGELRVARLAAQGLTNREIAQALFITTMTAKTHLRRVYRKLDITRRGQLQQALTGPLADSSNELGATATSIS